MDLKQQIQQGIQQAASANRFQLSGIPRHVHNGIDSPVVFQPIITYVGLVSFLGISVFLPKGWTVAQGTVPGNYVVTHNLGPGVLYTVSAIPSADSGSGHDSISYSIGSNNNNVDFFIFNTTTGAASVCDFQFTLTVVNNRSAQIPSYTITSAL